MTDKDLTIEVTAKLTVSDETARRCLKLLEMWQNDNPDKYIQGEKRMTTDGIRTYFTIVRREEGKRDAETKTTNCDGGGDAAGRSGDSNVDV